MKKYSHFTKQERDEISILLNKGYSHRDIAGALGKNHSSVSREIKNNSVNGIYDPAKAQHKARVKRLYSKYQAMKIRDNPDLEKYIQQRLLKNWTPEQISGRLKNKNNGKTVISFKTIYEYIYSVPGQRFCYLSDLKKYKYYRKQHRRRKRKHPKKPREHIKNRIFIDQRPKAINNRTRIGDFEGDTMGRPRSASSETLVILQDRKSRFILAKKVPALKYSIEGFKELLEPVSSVESLTLDNGVENIRYQELNIDTYFCHPYSPYEKGSVENSIGLIRRDYIPKKSDLKNFPQKQIYAIINELNERPRKCLNFRTPKEVFLQINH